MPKILEVISVLTQVGATAFTRMPRGHTQACREACGKGSRVLTLTECDESTLLSGAADANFASIRPVVEELARRMSAGEELRVTTAAGTDLTAALTGRKGIANTAICDQPGMRMGVPDIEVNVAPVESSIFGKIVIDASISTIGLLAAPVEIVFEQGRAVKIEGGREARMLKKLLEDTRTPDSYVLAEVAVGLNPKANVTGKIIEDEGTYLTGHFALGDNLGQGGANRAPVHVDMVYWRPTIEIDGQVVVEEGVPVVGIPCADLAGSR